MRGGITNERCTFWTGFSQKFVYPVYLIIRTIFKRKENGPLILCRWMPSFVYLVFYLLTVIHEVRSFVHIKVMRLSSTVIQIGRIRVKKTRKHETCDARLNAKIAQVLFQEGLNIENLLDH